MTPEAYKKDDPEAAARCLDKAIAHYCSKGSFRRAATHKSNLAELYENELGDNTRAAAAYEEAAGWYESVSLPSKLLCYLHLFGNRLTPNRTTPK
jgi:hypothetical protein